MPDDALQRTSQSLETLYQAIHRERMADMPMVNDAIGVHAVGFQHWNDSLLGILITPWCMNLMLLPGEHQDWSDDVDLSKVTHRFPSGSYEFINSSHADIGKYRMCSLFSPMFEFASDAVAVETATLILQELMKPENLDEQAVSAERIADIWNGDASREQVLAENSPHEAKPSAPTENTQAAENTQQPVSRRQLLRGMLQLDREDS